jgi:GNAT superfamily N-acetyltransferase
MSAQTLSITPIEDPAELDVVASLAREIWYEYYVPLIGKPQVDYMVERFQTASAMAAQMREGYEYFLVRREGRPIGYAAVQAQPAERTLFLSKFYLHRDARGAGTGRAFMEFLVQLALARGLVSIWLTVNKGNPSVGVYERMGFRIAADLRIDIGDGFVMDDFRMEKALLPS